jgi:hypothetical protein
MVFSGRCRNHVVKSCGDDCFLLASVSSPRAAQRLVSFGVER